MTREGGDVGGDCRGRQRIGKAGEIDHGVASRREVSPNALNCRQRQPGLWKSRISLQRESEIGGCRIKFMEALPDGGPQYQHFRIGCGEFPPRTQSTCRNSEEVGISLVP